MKINYADMTNHLGSSAVRDILKITQGKDIISLAGGLPAEELFPAEAIRDAYSRVLSGDSSALQYGLTEGYLRCANRSPPDWDNRASLSPPRK